MNAQALARDYLRKGKARRRALQILSESRVWEKNSARYYPACLFKVGSRPRHP
jgi:hypothetical protein